MFLLNMIRIKHAWDFCLVTLFRKLPLKGVASCHSLLVHQGCRFSLLFKQSYVRTLIIKFLYIRNIRYNFISSFSFRFYTNIKLLFSFKKKKKKHKTFVTLFNIEIDIVFFEVVFFLISGFSTINLVFL